MKEEIKAASSQYETSKRLSKKAERLSTQARRIGSWACWVGMVSGFIGAAASVYGVLISPADVSQYAIWFIMSSSAWVVVGIVQGVLSWEFLTKSEQKEKFVSKCRIVYLIVGIGCGLILVSTAGLWTYNDAFSDPAVADYTLKTLVALEVILFLSSFGVSMVLYNQYYKRVKMIDAQERRRRRKNKLMNRNRDTRPPQVSPPPYSPVNSSSESSPYHPRSDRGNLDSRSSNRNENKHNSRGVNHSGPFPIDPDEADQDELYKQILQLGEELRRDRHNRHNRVDERKVTEPQQKELVDYGSGPWTPDSLPYSGDEPTGRYLAMRFA